MHCHHLSGDGRHLDPVDVHAEASRREEDVLFMVSKCLDNMVVSISVFDCHLYVLTESHICIML